MRFDYSVLLTASIGSVIAAPAPKFPDPAPRTAFDTVLEKQTLENEAGNRSRDYLVRRDFDSTGCTLDEQTEAQLAADTAKNYVEKVQRYLSQAPDRDGLYTTWFGEFSPSRLNTVKSVFSEIKTGITDATYICGNPPYSTDQRGAASPYLFLRDPFWDLPTDGLDSKAGAIVHQLASFEDNLEEPVNFSHQQSLTKSRAYWDPDQAIHHPNNYRYFAESVGLARV